MECLMQYAGSDDEEECPFPPTSLPHPNMPTSPTSPSLTPHLPNTTTTMLVTPSQLIDKMTSQMESVVNEHHQRATMERVSTAPSSFGKQRLLPRPIHKSHSQSDDLLYNPHPLQQHINQASSPPSSHPSSHSPQPLPQGAHAHLHSSPPFSHPRPHSAPATPIHSPASPSPPPTELKSSPLNHTSPLHSHIPIPSTSRQRSSSTSHPHPQSQSQSQSHNHNNHQNHQNHKQSNNRFPGPPKKVVNMDEWDKVYQKWKSIEDEKAEKIKNKKEEKRKAEMAEASFKPRISKTSEKMVNNRENIVERMVNRKAETDKKIGQLRKLQEEVVLSTIKAIPTINQTSQKLQRPQGVMELWVRERDKKLDAMRTRQKEQEEAELKEYFKPQLNSKSLDLLSKKETEQQDVTVRLSEKIKKRTEKLEEMRKNSEHSHKPQINPRSKSIKLTTPVHERLYKVGMDSIVDKHKFMADNWDFSFTTRKPLTLGLDVEPNAMEVPSSPSPNELHTTGEDPFRGTEECYEEGHIQEYTRAEYNGVSWPHHQLPDYNNHVDMNNVDMNNANWPPQHQNYMTAADGEYGSVEEGGHHFNQHYGHVHPEQFVQEDLEYYYNAANSGYDEDLRRMMMEAGFFQSSYAGDYSVDDAGDNTSTRRQIL